VAQVERHGPALVDDDPALLRAAPEDQRRGTGDDEHGEQYGSDPHDRRQPSPAWAGQLGQRRAELGLDRQRGHRRPV
jgi:hypothetical protein